MKTQLTLSLFEKLLNQINNKQITYLYPNKLTTLEKHKLIDTFDNQPILITYNPKTKTTQITKL